MKVRFLIFIILITTSSCDKFSSSKKKAKPELTTIIDFSKVDISPTFYRCKDYENVQKIKCFRDGIYKRINRVLQSKELQILDESINEKIEVRLLISNQGKVSIKDINASEFILEAIPSIDSLLHIAVKRIPVLHPAYKKDIPVATEYMLPITITTAEQEKGIGN
ncbi:hypothetical protein WH52_11525 [Tenacibaculum holothuriorum]|uniref:TonB C-terminal domain-containing protein n=1 Tax=Tenacibaculum holothuriorum TaxID=1635173 RepID=A0A1Y2PCS1_9FLAO|nr:hypothetical protein [Tenacibaculum holothuriorum]OSY87488.1 hypothetical protein WH52_11525 [Tenacibaculum holothuriorum]